MLLNKNIDTIVFSMQDLDNFTRVVDGDAIGTKISN
jgi:uridylate kinase